MVVSRFLFFIMTYLIFQAVDFTFLFIKLTFEFLFESLEVRFDSQLKFCFLFINVLNLSLIIKFYYFSLFDYLLPSLLDILALLIIPFKIFLISFSLFLDLIDFGIFLINKISELSNLTRRCHLFMLKFA